MSIQERHFHGQASEPIYTPPGFCAAEPLPPLKTRRGSWPPLLALIIAAFFILFGGYALTAFHARATHAADCARGDVHTFLQCGDQP